MRLAMRNVHEFSFVRLAPRGALWSAAGLPPLFVTCNGAASAALQKAAASHTHSKALRRGDYEAASATVSIA
jgi:hypothetical protein